MASTSARKVSEAHEELTVYLPDTRGVTISPWGRGNLKLGPDVYTYSRLPGRLGGTCPGASEWCEVNCYAKRVVQTPLVWEMWRKNSAEAVSIPEHVPSGAKYVRLHVSGDFDSRHYIEFCTALVQMRRDVQFWTYTRSWRILELLPSLETLAAEPNMQLFASMDTSIHELPPATFRRAWLVDDDRAHLHGKHNEVRWIAADNRPALVCPEERDTKPNCQECGYCIRAQRGDVVFLVH